MNIRCYNAQSGISDIPRHCLLLIASVLMTALSQPRADAAVIFNGDFAVGGLPPSLIITDPIPFTVTSPFGANTTQIRFVFDDVVASDGGQTFVLDGSRGVDLLINGTPFTLGASTQLIDNFAIPIGDFGANDGVLWGLGLNPVPLAPGDVITLVPQAWNFGEDNSFNAAYSGNPFNFAGNVFIAGSGTSIIATSAAVPEPATTLATTVLLLAGFLARRCYGLARR